MRVSFLIPLAYELSCGMSQNFVASSSICEMGVLPIQNCPTPNCTIQNAFRISVCSGFYGNTFVLSCVIISCDFKVVDVVNCHPHPSNYTVPDLVGIGWPYLSPRNSNIAATLYFPIERTSNSRSSRTNKAVGGLSISAKFQDLKHIVSQKILENLPSQKSSPLVNPVEYSERERLKLDSGEA